MVTPLNNEENCPYEDKLEDTMEQFMDIAGTWVIGTAVILAGMIKIPPIQLNFWSWLGRLIGRAINGEVLERVYDLSKEIDNLKKDAELERVRDSRQRILRFNDEILFGTRHSKEHFDEILEDITLYEQYCREHKEYENNKAVLAIVTIRDVYQECMKDHDFLTYIKK